MIFILGSFCSHLYLKWFVCAVGIFLNGVWGFPQQAEIKLGKTGCKSNPSFNFRAFGSPNAVLAILN